MQFLEILFQLLCALYHKAALFTRHHVCKCKCDFPLSLCSCAEKRTASASIAGSADGGAAPIVDICLVNLDKKDSIPRDFELIEKTLGGLVVDLFGACGARFGLCYRRAAHIDEQPICDIQVLYMRSEVVPVGYTCLVETATGVPLQWPADCEPIAIAYTRRGHTAIANLALSSPAHGEKTPSSFFAVPLTASGRTANLNPGARDHDMIVCFTKGANACTRIRTHPHTYSRNIHNISCR